jgi:hypothetical protein
MTTTLKAGPSGSGSCSGNAAVTGSRRWAWFLAVPPLVAVVAGLTTVYIAVTNPDPVLPRETSTRGAHGAGLPAQMGRNQAATEAAKQWSEKSISGSQPLDSTGGVQK